MKILVAGGAGYLGSVLIPRLLERGYSVDVVELFWFGNHLPGEVGILNKDLFDLTVEDLRAYEQVIFLAGLSNDPMAEFSPSKNFIFNAAAPAYLAYISKRALVRRSFMLHPVPCTDIPRMSSTTRLALPFPAIPMGSPSSRANRRHCSL